MSLTLTVTVNLTAAGTCVSMGYVYHRRSKLNSYEPLNVATALKKVSYNVGQLPSDMCCKLLKHA